MRRSIRLPRHTGRAAPFLAAVLVAGLASSSIGAALAAASPAGTSVQATRAPATLRSAPRAAAGAVTAIARPQRTAVTRTSPASVLVSTACTLATTTWSCDLYAKAGTLTLPDATTVPIWGYASTSGDPAGLPGPTLIVGAGKDLQITLHNVNLPSATSLAVSQLPMIPDTAGVAAGGNKTYTIAAADLRPGTYLYEAGLTPDGPRQAAMGLIGALVVRPASCGVAANCAYDASSPFDDEAVLVLSEVDPAFNAAPSTFDLNYFAPKYWLINGKGFPATDPIATDAAHGVLLRYVNAGLVHHAMSVLGLHQTIVAADGQPLPNPQTVVDDTVPSGSTVDAIATIPGDAPKGTKFAVYEAAMHLDNNGIATTPAAASPENTPIAFGGMLTFMTVAGSSSTPHPPVTSGVSLTPNITNGTGLVTLAATETSAASTVTAAEYFVDAVGTSGAGCAMTGSFGAATVAVSATIPATGGTLPCADLASLASGSHTFYVHGRDATGAWGAVASAVLTLDKTGPAVSGLSLTPSRTNGSANVVLQGTASDVATGNQNVTAAEYAIDGGPATAISAPTPAAIVSLQATIPASAVTALADGAHTVTVRAQDAVGNWGATTATTLIVDKTGPTTGNVSATPNPTNGLFGVQIGSTGQLYERIDATITDPVAGGVNSTIVAAEYFIDTVGANGTGGGMLAADGVFNSSNEGAVGAAEIFGIAALSSGSHTIYVHAKDAAGNWGGMSSTTLVVDHTRPFISSAGLTPNPTAGATTVTLNVAVVDSTNINRVEYFIGADPGLGNGTSVTTTPVLPATSVTGTASINVGTLALGSYTVSVRARDTLGNWSAVTTLPLVTTALFADGFESGSFSAWSSAVNAPTRITVGNGAAAQAGTYGMAAQISGGTSGYVQDNTPAAETTYNARFYLNPNTAGLANLTPYTIFRALNNANAERFNVQLRVTGGTYQVRAVLTRNGGTNASGWFNVPGSAFTAVETIWRRVGNNLAIQLYTGGILRQTVTGTSSTATQAQYRIDTVRLGPQGTLTGASGTIYVDSFVSTRTTAVGP